ncbi:MAG: chalcone isomerase family protein [Gammaproteobacteria bacterium]|nr:chalcone isomerase family protein [Gammaproteobacteria bacterium]
MFKKTLFVLLLVSTTVQARELAGITVEEQIKLGASELTLNGAGVRTKFVFDVYVAAFYTQSAVKAVSALNMQQPMRMAMHFVYDEVSKEKLVDAWNNGFDDNLSSDQYAVLKNKIKQFNALFETVHKGDVIWLDYTPEKGTAVSINKNEKGVVDGADFYKALLLIWLGEDPAGERLKKSLLGKANSEDE